MVSVCLDAVQSAVMRLLPRHHTLPVGKDGRLYTRVEIMHHMSKKATVVLKDVLERLFIEAFSQTEGVLSVVYMYQVFSEA